MTTIAYRGASRMLAASHALNPATLGRRALALLARQRSRAALAQMDDRLLADIGLTREQARAEAAKPFWTD